MGIHGSQLSITIFIFNDDSIKNMMTLHLFRVVYVFLHQEDKLYKAKHLCSTTELNYDTDLSHI